jgi:PTS system cellobiose-specific IIA component
MEDLELLAFKIISGVGSARSSYIEAIAAAKAGDFERAENLIKEGEESFVEGHHSHLKLMEAEGKGQNVISLLVLHAEDQLMSAEAYKTIAKDFIDTYKRIETLENQIKQ